MQETKHRTQICCQNIECNVSTKLIEPLKPNSLNSNHRKPTLAMFPQNPVAKSINKDQNQPKHIEIAKINQPYYIKLKHTFPTSRILL